MTDPTHKQIMRVAEELTSQMIHDYEEVCNFVYESLCAQYKDKPECFAEDWRDYVGEALNTIQGKDSG